MKIKGFKRHKPNFDEDKPITYPAQCMCCWDSGLVGIPHELYSFFIDGEQERPFVCSRPECKHGRRYHEAIAANQEQRKALLCTDKDDYDLQFDVRFTADMCESLHQYQQEQWRKTVINARLRREKLKEMVSDLSQNTAIPSAPNDDF